MKKILNLLLLALLLPLALSAQRTKVVSLDYNISDFNVKLDKEKNTVISSDKYTIFFRKALDAPALPCVGVKVLIGREEDMAEYDVSFTEVKLGSLMQMKANPRAVRDDEQTDMKVLQKPSFNNAVYPDTIVKYIGTCCRDGYRYLVFNVCPFAFVKDGGSLFLRHHIELQIQLFHTNSMVKYGPCVGTNMRDVVRRQVINPEELDVLYPRRSKSLTRVATTVIPSIADTEDYEYIIITRNSMKAQFQSLANWKTMKGVRTKVITTEDILSNYEVPSQYYISNTYMQKVFKIKTAIQDYYDNHGTKYVLIGGDGLLVPYFKANDMWGATDWFYACIYGGAWDWGYCSQGLSPSFPGIEEATADVYVSRALVADTTDARTFVNRVIEYESETDPDEWDFRALFWGSKILYNYQLGGTLKSDAQHFGDWIQDYSFSNVNYCDRLYDTYSNLGYPLTLSNLKNTMDEGYEFIHFSTYLTYQDNLRLPNDEYYTVSDAEDMASPHYTLMTTATGYLIDYDYSFFADRFMNNPNNKVIAFMGSTGIAYHSSDSSQILHNDLYMREFYEILFDRDACHFGEIAALAKSVFEPDEYYQYNDVPLLTNLNPIGDCEMTIYVPDTYAFGDGTGPVSDRITISYSNGILHVDTPDDCRICVMSKADYGATYYAVIDSVSQADFAPPLVECTVSVTHPEYKPFVKTIFSPVYVQNETLNGNNEFVGNQVFIGYDVTSSKPLGPVTINSGTTNVRTRQAFIKNRFEVKLGAKFSITNN